MRTPFGRKAFRVEKACYADKERDIALLVLPEDAGLAPLPCRENLPRRGEATLGLRDGPGTEGRTFFPNWD